MDKQPERPRTDPIRSNYFRQMEIVESISSWLFHLGALASFAPLIIERNALPRLYAASLVVFLLLVVCNFIAGMANRLYLFPRAENERRRDFISNAFGFDLTHQRTSGYYNNSETDPYRRMGFSVLENLFFTKTVLRKMAVAVRARALVYLIAWLAVLAWRNTPLNWIAAAAQVLLSEEIIARWLRLEWIRNRSESLYDSTHQLFQLGPVGIKLAAYAIESFGAYEAGKSLGGILLSQKIFDRINPGLSEEWELVKSGLSSLSQP